MPSISMKAPGPFQKFQAQDGSSYTSDQYGIIANVSQEDIVNLVNSGCVFMQSTAAIVRDHQATTAPAATDDLGKGFNVGSRWLDTTNKNEYVCVDATANAAVWIAFYAPGVVNVTAASLTVTAAAHAGKVIVLNKADGLPVTLPAATGTGNVYDFVIGTTITSNSTTIKVPNATDSMLGSVMTNDTDAAGTGKPWAAAANDDTITLNGVATGGKAGDRIRLTDVAANMWSVEGFVKQSGGSEATPFSATVS